MTAVFLNCRGISSRLHAFGRSGWTLAGQEVLQVGKEDVTIKEIKPIGNYAIAPVFSDGHNSGIYTWDLLYKLGAEYQTLWADYLHNLEAAGHKRKEPLHN